MVKQGLTILQLLLQDFDTTPFKDSVLFKIHLSMLVKLPNVKKNSISLIRTFCHLTNFVDPLVKITYKLVMDIESQNSYF